MPDSDESNTQEIVFRRARRRIRLSYIFAGLSTCAVLSCVGCCLFSRYLFGAQGVEGDEDVKKLASEIINWKLPPGFAGEVGIRIDNSAFRFDVAKFSQKKGRGSLIIAKSNWRAWQPPDDQKVRRQFIEKLSEWVKPDLRTIDAQEHETRALVACGLQGECEINHGEDRASTTKYRQVVGYFHDKSADAYLILECEDEFLTAQEIDDFLNSIE